MPRPLSDTVGIPKTSNSARALPFAATQAMLLRLMGTHTMRTVLLASALALIPDLVTAQHCTAPAEASAGASPRGTAPPPGLPTPSKPVLPPEQVDAAPALRALAAKGAELYDLGVRHGLRGVFARAADRTSLQVFYLTPDGEGVPSTCLDWDALVACGRRRGDDYAASGVTPLTSAHVSKARILAAR